MARKVNAGMYAVIESGGKQYRATEQSTLRVEKLDVAVGDEVRLERVLLLSGDGGVKIGRPYVDGAVVTARVVRQGKGRKIHGFTYKPKKNCHRRYGHRQLFTEVVIQKIEG
jgi:large subunit ribosomal protein L21